MRLQEWFTQASEQKLSETEKQQIYASVLDATHKTVFLKKTRFYIKAATYTFATAGAMLLFFASYTPEKGPLYVITGQNSAITTLQQQPTNAVQADTVGTIINTEGAIRVFKNEQEVNTGKLSDGDIVLLEQDARVEVNVRDGVKATITGPAKFTIQRIEDESGAAAYVLNLLEGSYAEIVTLPKKKDLEDIENIEEQETVIVKTKTIEIQQTPAKRNLHITISEDDEGAPVVTNQGDDILVKKIGSDDEGALTVVGADQIVVFDSEQLVLSDEDNSGTLDEKQLTIRYEIQEPLVLGTESAVKKDVIVEDSSVDSLDSKEIIPTSIEEGKIELPAEEERITKRILKEESLNAVSGAIDPIFVTKHLQDITLHHALGSDGGYAIARGNLSKLINRARGAVELGPVGSTIPQMIGGLSELQGVLNNDYFVPPSVMSPLMGTKRWLQSLQTVPYGLYSEETYSDYSSVINALIDQEYGVASSIY